jgi:FixJ family two-component response regulator
MPNLSGKGLHQALQKLPDSPPILFTSGSSQSDLRCEDLLDPSLPLVSKPWDMTELAGKIREVLALATGEPN